MSESIGDTIGSTLITLFILIFILGAIIGIGGYFLISWLISNITIIWG